MKRTCGRALFTAMFFLSSFGLLWAQQQNDTSQVPADNTKVNQRDRNSSEPTADQQKKIPRTGNSRNKSAAHW